MGKANFGISIDNPGAVVVAGDVVTGRIWADIAKEIKGSTFQVDFTGKEATCCRYTTTRTTGSGNNQHTVTETHHAYGKRNIISIRLPVEQLTMLSSGSSPGRIAPGRYVLPFEFVLPSFLPSTFEHHHNGGYAKIRYKFKAILKGSGMLWNYNCERDVMVKSAMVEGKQALRVPYEGPPVTAKVNFCCCFNQGSMTLGAFMDTTALVAGEAPANVSFACRNNSTAECNTVRAQLKQRVHWTASGGHSERVSTVLFEANFPTTGLQAKSKQEAKQQVATRDIDNVQRERASILEELRSYSNSRQITVPPNCVSSYNGSIIQVSHELKVWVETPCCVNNPEVRIPLQCFDAVVKAAAPPNTTTSTSVPLFPPSSAPYEPEIAVATPLPSAPLEPIPFSPTSDGYEPEIVYGQAIRIDSEHAVFGGAATASNGKDDEDDDIVVPGNATAYQNAPPSVTTLLNEMKDAVGDVEVVSRRVNNPTWKSSVFAHLSPTDFATIISHVQSSFDQIPVATLLAESVEKFTCQHVAKALQCGASEWNRTALAERLFQYCSDLSTNQQQILSILTDWERSVVDRALQEALRMVS